jgi:hypothetical protein
VHPQALQPKKNAAVSKSQKRSLVTYPSNNAFSVNTGLMKLGDVKEVIVTSKAVSAGLIIVWIVSPLPIDQELVLISSRLRHHGLVPHPARLLVFSFELGFGIQYSSLPWLH